MSPAPDPKHDLHRLLRALPDRTAPSSLETRVLRELDRRARLPWWRRSYAAWPPFARMLFFTFSALAAAALIAAATRLGSAPTAGAASSLAQAWSPWEALASSLAAAVGDLASRIPAAWVYGSIGFVAACSATVLAAAAVAVRTIRRPRSDAYRFPL